MGKNQREKLQVLELEKEKLDMSWFGVEKSSPLLNSHLVGRVDF